MPVLTVYAMHPSLAGNHVIVRVYWKTGKRNQGALDVALPTRFADAGSAAEVAALRYLLGVKKVSGENLTGAGLEITCSRGAVRKIALGISSKSELYEYSYPLVTRYAGAKYEISKETDWIKEGLTLEKIDAEQIASGLEIVETQTFGPVGITIHALDRYVEKEMPTSPKSTGWKSLSKRLDSGLLRVTLPARVVKHKLRKYGSLENTEIWKHPDDPLHYVFSAKHNHRALVTVFRNSENFV